MITLITGLPGSGKSLFTLKTVNDLATKENRPVFYHGIPELTLPWELMEKPEQWVDLPSGSIVVIDECQTSFRPRAASVAPPRHVSELETHRHKGLDFFLITQHPMLIDSNVRRLTGRHYHVERFYGFQKSTINEFQQVRENCDKSTKGAIKTHFVYPKEVFNWYKSADLHTVKKRLPARLFLIVALPIFLIWILWTGYQAVLGIAAESESESAVSSPASSAAGQLMPAGAVPVVDYFGGRVERVAGLPHTAPVYDEVTKPVEAPLPAACVEIRGQCTCYSQQATKLNTPPDICRQIVEKGYFVDFENGDALQAKQQPFNVPQRGSERVVSGSPQNGGERVAAGSVDLPTTSEQRSPSKITRERMAASKWAYRGPSDVVVD